MFGLVHRGELPNVVENEFEHLATRLQHLWLVEHNEDGSHRIDLMDVAAAAEHTHDAADIISGELDVDRIPDLSADKITSDELSIDRIPTLTKAKQHAQTAYKDESNVFSADQEIVVVSGVAAGFAAQNTATGGARWNFGSFADNFHITESGVQTWLTLNKTTGRLDLSGSAGIRERNRSVAMGEWQAYTPTWTNLTIGNGSQSAFYTLVGKTAFVTIVLDFGSTTVMGSAPSVTLPVTARDPNLTLGNIVYLQGSVAWYPGFFIPFLGTSIAPSFLNGTNLSFITATAPFTWGDTDRINISLFYEIA